MKFITRLFLFFLLQLWHFPSFGNVEGRVDLLKVTDKIYVVEDTFYVRENSAIYIGEKGVTVISATWSPETAKLLSEKIRQLTRKPITTVINTHHHLDRVGGNSYFNKIGAKIVASKKTSDLMTKKWKSMIRSHQKSFSAYPSLPLISPDVTFETKYELERGKVQILYFGPSHTEDGVVVYFPDEKILYGDCILKEKLGNLDDANLSEYPKTLERIKKLPIKTIIAGHWTPLHGPELIDRLLEQLKDRASKAH